MKRLQNALGALYAYGLYPLFYLLMQASLAGSGFFTQFDHLVLLAALLAQTWLLAGVLRSVKGRFLGALIAPAAYSVAGVLAGESAWITDMSHAFFWLSALPLAALGAFANRGGAAISATGLINVAAFVFIYFFFDLKANADYYRHFTDLTVTAQTVHVGFFFEALGLFVQEPHHRYVVLGGLLLGLFIATAQATALLGARKLEKLNRELESRIEAGVEKQIEQERLLVQQSRMAALGEMMGMVSHQWKQPLSIIGMLSQTVQLQLEKPAFDRTQIEEDLRMLDDQVRYMNQTAEDFRGFLKPSKSKTVFDLQDAVNQTLLLSRRLIEYGGIRLSYEKPADRLDVSGYPNEFKQALMNLLINAREAVLAAHDDPKKGAIELRLAREQNEAVLTLCDNGGGIQNGESEAIFENFFSTKPKGTGLGLYMVRTIIQGHMGGTVSAKNRDKGACFTLRLPLV